MTNKILIRVLIFIGIILSIVVYNVWKDYSKMKLLGFSGMINDTSIEFPVEYASLFKDSERNKIKHINSSVISDSLSFPISSIKINDQLIKIFKFNSELNLNELVDVKYEKTKQNNLIWYRDHYFGDLSVNIARKTIKKQIYIMELVLKGEMDKLILNHNTFLCNGNLKTLSVRFSKENVINNIFIKNDMFNYPEYSIAVIKRGKSIFLLFFASNKVSENEFYEMLNIQDL